MIQHGGILANRKLRSYGQHHLSRARFHLQRIASYVTQNLGCGDQTRSWSGKEGLSWIPKKPSSFVFVIIERNNPFMRATRFNLFRSDPKWLGRMKIRFHRRKRISTWYTHGTIRLHNLGGGCIRRAKGSDSIPRLESERIALPRGSWSEFSVRSETSTLIWHA